jgi:NAD(P)-dependent dehydrogenase (short-subunit alcohol dehydrogenase family)
LPVREHSQLIYSTCPHSHHLTPYRSTVTGANRGIGLGVAECCLINGATKVYSIDLAAPGEEYVAIEKAYPGRLGAVQANVADEQSITAAMDKIIEESGALHGVVANAGRTNHKAALDFTKEEVEALFNVNVSSFRQAVVSCRVVQYWFGFVRRY